MPKVILTYKDVANTRVEKLKVQCLGVKALKKLSWEDIADEMLLPRSTLVYRWNNNLLTLSEWLELINVLGIEKGEIDL